jgi:hypothetical protein
MAWDVLVWLVVAIHDGKEKADLRTRFFQIIATLGMASLQDGLEVVRHFCQHKCHGNYIDQSSRFTGRDIASQKSLAQPPTRAIQAWTKRAKIGIVLKI